MSLQKQTDNPRTEQFRNYATYRSTQVPTRHEKKRRRWPLVALILVFLVGGVFVLKPHKNSRDHAPAAPAAYAKKAAPRSKCANNKLDKFIVVSIAARHLWACEQGTQVYDSPVITGMQQLPADLTPTGTYKIYAKEANVTLKGSDSTGSWVDPVSYWMPFLDNEYGTYGFHDATWRSDDEFGHIDPGSDNGSHGCVELPLATSRWLYNWAQVGTQLTITS